MTTQDQRGSASILTLFFILAVFAVGALTADLGKAYCIKITVKHKLNLALRGAAAQLDENELKNARLVIDQLRSQTTFLDILKTNLKLDNSMMPLAGSVLSSGPVRVVYFKVIDSGEAPFEYTYGSLTETVNRVAVVAVISYPVENSIFARMAGAPGESTFYCRVTCAPELFSRLAGEI